MATTRKPDAAPTDEPVDDGAPQAAEANAGEPVLPRPAVELVSDGEQLPGGTYINTGLTDLVLLQPPAVLKPGRVIELEFGIRHRDLSPATTAEIKAARDAEAAEQAAAAQAEQDATSGQEQ